MPKGLYTHGAVILLKSAPVFETVERQLARFDPRVAEPGPSWEFGGPCCVIPYRPQTNGYLVVDLVNRPWPDSMGEPPDDLFAAWAMGQFGPFTYPGSLQRALQHSYSWPERPETHAAFLRLRMTYVIGAEGDAPVMPSNYDALAELNFATDVALALADLPEALAYFNPSGEVLSFPSRMRELIAHYRGHALPPLDLWTNIRMFAMDDGWTMMDTVGMAQLDLDDLEVVFHRDDVDGNAGAAFLRNASLYVGQHGPTIKDGHTMEGYLAQTFPEALVAPPRGVLRFRPLKTRRTLPQAFQFGERKRLFGLF